MEAIRYFSIVFFAVFFATVIGIQIAKADTLIFDHPNPQAGANFGAAIAQVGDIDGDGTLDLLVGAPLQDIAGNPDQGQAFVVSGADGAILFTLNNPTPQTDAEFGSAVADVGDIDGDGKSDFLVGAPGQDVGPCKIGNTDGCSVGQAYVLSGVDGTLLLTLNHPTPRAGSFLGSAVASAGDLNGDLIPELIVGAPGQNIGVFVPSQVFVFDGDTGNLLLTLDDPNPSESESLVGLTFGSVVTSVGDLDTDGVPDILVGDAQQDVGGNTDQGQVSIFSGDDGTLLLTLDNPTPQADAFFGASAASIGDVNGDAIPDLIVGAPDQNAGGNPRQGQAHVFSGANGALLLTVDDPTPQTDASFGSAVDSIGDVNSDGIPDIIVGAPDQDAEGNSGQGQAYVFSGDDGALLLTLDNPTPQIDAAFGSAVVSGGDLDGDGSPDPVVGAPFQNVDPNPLQGQVSSPTPTGANRAPIANAGPDQTVNEGSLVNLDGSESSDPDGDAITFSWTQTTGPTVTLSDPSSATPAFTAPEVMSDTVLTFELIVNDGQASSGPDSVNVTVLNAVDGPDLVGEFTKLERKTDRKGDTLSFTLLVTNIGNKPTSGGFTVEFYLSADNTLDGSDTLVFSKTLKDKGSEGKVQPGSSVTISKTLKIKQSTQGKFLIALVDSEDTIPETNEENNITSEQIP